MTVSIGSKPAQPPAPPLPDTPESHIRAALDALALESISPVAAGLAFLFAVLTIGHILTLRRFAAVCMVPMAATTSVILFLLWRHLKRVRISPRWAHPIGIGIAGLVLVNSLLHLRLLAEAEQTTNLMLLIMGAGFLLLSARWLAVLIAMTVLGWAGAAAGVFSAEEWRHFGFALFTSSIIAIMVHTVRVRTLWRLEMLRLRDQVQQRELSAALTLSEESRQHLEASKHELEELMHAVQQGEEKFRRFTDLEGIAIHKGGTIVEINAALARMFQYDPAEMIGMEVSRLLAADVRQAVSAKLASEFHKPYEAIGVKKDGTTLPIELSGKPVPYADQRASAVMIRDITDRKRAEAALKEADRRKDEFLAMLGHELRNPLTPIRNAVEALKMLGPTDPASQRSREIIERQVRHMARLVDDLLDVSRISRGKILLRREPLDLVALVRSAVEDQRSSFDAAGIALCLEIDPVPLPVFGDPTRLAQVVGNVLHNANKFTDAGGCVSVRVGRANDRTGAVITVRDSGIGIEPHLLTRVFEPFDQADHSAERNRGGLGLGLALVKGLVAAHGGAVELSSAGLGHGCEFTIRLPLEQRPACAAGEAPDLRSTATYRVLLIEDDPDAAESTKMLLDLAGHHVAVAHAGSSGIELARQFRPDIVLCDIGLPGGMDGYAVAKALRQEPVLAAAYLIAITGYGQEEDRRRAREADFDLHLTKPFDFSELQRAFAALASHKRFILLPKQ